MEEQLLQKLNQMGFIPGPNESIDIFLQRVELAQKFYQEKETFLEKFAIKMPFPLQDKALKPLRHWSRSLLIRKFDITPDILPVYFHNHELSLFQGAATWFLELGENKEFVIPLLQFRRALKKGSYLRIYSFDEILAHEMIHAARACFQEKIFEEHFAYLTSSSSFRRIFGPIFRNPKEIIVFFSLLGISLFSSIMPLSSFYSSIVVSLSFYFLTTFSMLGIMRLLKNHFIFLLCRKKIRKILKNKEKSLHVMLRLTDKEIFSFAFSKKKKIFSYITKEKDQSLRWKVIYLAYFAGLKLDG